MPHVAALVLLNGGGSWGHCRSVPLSASILPSPHSIGGEAATEMGLCSRHPCRPPAGHSFTRIDREQTATDVLEKH
jgi:hypothetical protein